MRSSRIAEATGKTDFQREFTVIEDTQVNAFCLPGGKVAVYAGILPITRDDAGLAAVARAGYHPSAAKELWVRIKAASRGGQKPPESLSTHPSEATRIKQIEGWLPEAMSYYRPC